MQIYAYYIGSFEVNTALNLLEMKLFKVQK